MNKFIFMGRLTKDPEVRSTNTGKQVAEFNIAVARQFKGPNGETESDFFKCTAFGSVADVIIKYCKKADQILIEGRIQNRTWEDQTGAKRYSTDFIITNVTLIGNKKNNNINDVSQIVDNNDGEYITIDDNADLPF